MPKIYLSGDALARNYRLLKTQTSGKLIPVLKADAYGHGALFALQTLLGEGAKLFAVACAYEARELLDFISKSKHLFTNFKILVLGTVEEEELASLASPHIIFSVHSPRYARWLSYVLGRLKADCLLPDRFTLSVHLKLETGMHRLGLRTEEAIRAVLTLPHLKVEGAYSHLAHAANEERTQSQHRRFLSLASAFDGDVLTHLSASEGLLRYGDFSLSAVRVGMALYGVPPAETDLSLSPVMRFSSRVLSVFTARAGDYVGYGSLPAQKTRRLAVIDAGYADGIPRVKGDGRVHIEGYDCLFFGHVCMDRATLDIGNAPFREGDEITLFGKTAGDTARFAAALGLTPYELLSHRSARTQRILLP